MRINYPKISLISCILSLSIFPGVYFDSINKLIDGTLIIWFWLIISVLLGPVALVFGAIGILRKKFKNKSETWHCIIGIAIGSFYYLQPYFEQVTKAYSNIQETQKKFSDIPSSMKESFEKYMSNN